jgi:hypothetical protein
LPSGEVATYKPPFGAGASAWASSSALSKKTEPRPWESTRKTLPSLPVPTNSEPSAAASSDQRNGAAVS